MKWLILFPLWVFMLSYVFYRVRESKRAEVLPDRPVAAAPGAPGVVVPVAPVFGLPREASIDAVAMAAMADAFAAKVQLIPVDDDARQASPLWPSEGLAEGARALAARDRFDQWRLNTEVDGVSFYLPQGAGLTVERVAEGDVFPMLGEIFFQDLGEGATWYRVAGSGGVTWAALAVDGAAEFDRRARFPEGEVFHKVLLADGGVARVSLAADGAPVRVQWLGEGVRVSLLDWQHCAAHRAAYTALAASVRIGAGGESGGRGARMARLASAAGIEWRLELLERGMGAGQVETLLGRPGGVDGVDLIYDAPRREGGARYRVALENDRFDGFREGWRGARTDPPIPGTMEWMLEKTEIRAGQAGGVGYDLGQLTDEDVAAIFSQVGRRLPGADAGEWADLCRVLANLSELRLSDASCGDLVRGRFMEEELPAGAAIIVLRTAAPDAARGLFAEKAGQLLGEREPAADDLQLMFAYIGKRYPGAGDLVRRAAQHQSAAVRAVAYTYWDWFDETARAPLLLRGLRDADADVRRRSAEALATAGAAGAAGAAGVESAALQRALEDEADGEVRAHLQRAIDGLGD